ncbi:cytochrome P450 [Myxococcota bacterium]|nr:cytochrome P450 [Myxococcota bacterium]
MVSSSQSKAYNPFWESMLDDPFPTYRWLRDEHPVYHIEEFDCWAVSRFEDVMAISMDNDDFTIERGSAVGNLATRSLAADTTLFMSMDPPRHTAYRRVLSPWFRPSRVAALEPRLRQIVSTVMEPLVKRGTFDAVQDVASRVGARVTAAILGVPEEDADPLTQCVHRFQPYFHHRPPDDEESIAFRDAAAGDLVGYFVELSARRRREPGPQEDLVQVLIDAETPDGPLDDLAVATNLMGLWVGGVETVPKHFGSLVFWLHEFPEQRARVVADPALLAPAVEEALRYDAPTHMLGRTVARPRILHGVEMREGQGVLLLYASANRDEREFDDPECFDVTRRPPRQLAFGGGTHLCLGLHVARLESRLMLEALLEAGPSYVLESGVERCRLAGIHGYDAVPLSLRP